MREKGEGGLRREAIGLITKQAGDTLPILDLLMSLRPPTDPRTLALSLCRFSLVCWNATVNRKGRRRRRKRKPTATII